MRPLGAPRWSRLEQDERRRQILTAATELFGMRHYSSVSMQEIAAAAGVTRGLLNHYFGSKRALYLAVARGMLETPALPVTIDPARSVDENWALSVDGWLDLMETNRETFLAAVRAGETGDDPEMRALVDAASELLAERVIDALGMDSTTASPALRAVVRSYGGLVQEATREWLERGRLDREQLRLLLTGAMPLIARDLVPAIVDGGHARLPSSP